MAVSECIVLKEYGVVRLNAAIAEAIADGFTPQPGIMAGEDSWLMMVMKKDDAVTATGCKVVLVDGVERLGQFITDEVAAGMVPFGPIHPIGADSYAVVFASGLTSGGEGGSVTVDDIEDATATGKSLMKAADAAAARTAIGAGTSNLEIGTTATTAKAGDYKPVVADISDSSGVGRAALKAAVIAYGATQAEARTAIGAGTGNSNLVIGTSSTQAKAGNYQPTAANISDAGAFGRQLLQCVDQAAAKTLLGIS